MRWRPRSTAEAATGLGALTAALLAPAASAVPLSTDAPVASCLFHGRPRAEMDLPRAEACRAVLDGLGEDRDWPDPLLITISLDPPATATVRFVGTGTMPAPISIAIGPEVVRRRDFVTLGRTIAQLLRAY